ncbi:MAG TPA: hypothetical protein VF281_02595 [Candidatus Saccharimonadales bacterium]
MQTIDAHVESHIDRFIQRIERAIEGDLSPYAFIRATPIVEFLSRLEWNLLKQALYTDDDSVLIEYIESLDYYQKTLVPRFNDFNHTIHPNGNEIDLFCVIELDYTT